MKTKRGSARASTRGPKTGGQRSRKRPAEEGGQKKQKAEAQLKPQKQRVEHAVRKVKGQEKWRPLPKTSITALGNILDLSILSAITMKGKDKEESQRHLNQLKDRFLASCAQLKVPPRAQKLGDMLQVSRVFRAESKKKTTGSITLQALKDKVSTVVGALEQMEGKMESLEQEIRTLRGKLEDEEENAQEILQMSEKAVLNLPPLPPQVTRELPLQEQMVKDPEVAARLASTVHGSAPLQEMRAFLELAHKQADRLLPSISGPSPSAEPEGCGARDMQGSD